MEATESVQADYSMLMPFIVKALLDNRARYEARAAEVGEETLVAEEPKARGYLRPRAGYRLYEQRTRLLSSLKEALRTNGGWLRETLAYPLTEPRP
jgi:deoxyhypusine synthase